MTQVLLQHKSQSRRSNLSLFPFVWVFASLLSWRRRGGALLVSKTPEIGQPVSRYSRNGDFQKREEEEEKREGKTRSSRNLEKKKKRSGEEERRREEEEREEREREREKKKDGERWKTSLKASYPERAHREGFRYEDFHFLFFYFKILFSKTSFPVVNQGNSLFLTLSSSRDC